MRARILRPFAQSYIRKELDSIEDRLKSKKQMEDNLIDRNLKRVVLRSYWEFIKPYHNSIEMILGTHESIFVPEELIAKTLDALGSKRNRAILREIALYNEKYATGMTLNELFEKMGLSKGAKKGLWRNLDELVRSGLVTRIPEGERLHKYSIYGNKSVIRIRLPLTKTKKRAT